MPTNSKWMRTVCAAGIALGAAGCAMEIADGDGEPVGEASTPIRHGDPEPWDPPPEDAPPEDPPPPPPPPPPPDPSAPVRVELAIDRLTALAATDGDQDEIYMRVAGVIPGGAVSTHVPRTAVPYASSGHNYYAVNAAHTATREQLFSWITGDGAPLGHPRLWAGQLRNGEYVNFVVLLSDGEFDWLGAFNKPLRAFVTWAITAAGAPWLAPVVGIFPESTSDQVVGGFGVRITNNAGSIAVEWTPLGAMGSGSITDVDPDQRYRNELLARGHLGAQSFVMRSGAGVYLTSATVEARPGGILPALRYSGDPYSRDSSYNPVPSFRCDAGAVSVASPLGRSTIPSGRTTDLLFDSLYGESWGSWGRDFSYRTAVFQYECGSIRREIGCWGAGANFVRVTRSADGRDIRFSCFEEVGF